MPSGADFQASHAWNTAGIYTITAYASDNETSSQTASHIILIDACLVKTIGYILDTNSDGTYDMFHHNNTGLDTKTEKTNNGYLLDYDNDGKWDHIFNLPADLLSAYNEDKNAEKTPGFELVLVFVAVMIILMWKRKK
jgi:hypothetical protein